MAIRQRNTRSTTAPKKTAQLKLKGSSPEPPAPASKEDPAEGSEGLLDTMEKFVLQVETKLENLEKVSSEFIDVKFHALAKELALLKQDVRDRTVKASETFISTIESHMGEINDSLIQTSMNARWQRATEYYDSTLKAMEASHIEASLEKARDRLLRKHEMPLPWHNNPYIVNGYKFCHSYAECVRSAFQIHNETCNIWTHAIAFFIMIGLAFYHLPTTEEWLSASWADTIPVSIFLIASLKCLVCSVTWHLFCNIRYQHVHNAMACVDYTGIMLLITASILTVEYAALYCHPTVQAFYLTLTSICGLAGVMFTWHPAFDKLLLLRISFFISFAAAGAIAGLHAMFYEGFWPVFKLHIPVFKSLASYVGGVVFYVGRIPERFFPEGVFDYIGMSHNLWHLAVFGGIYYHYQACIHLLRHGVSMTCNA